MNEAQEKSLLDRIEKLEAAVARIQEILPQAAPIPEPPSLSSPAPAKEPKATVRTPERDYGGEYWLNKIGIGLLLFGMVFLFKYTIDKGWLIPPVRIGFGLALGVALLLWGVRIYKQRRHFSLVLIGGGIADFYITGFAAYQLFSLVSHPVSFAFMSVVTILAFALSIRQQESILSLIGTLGGLGTPFLLYSSSGNLPGLVMYTCTVLAGAMAMFFYRGWRSLFTVGIVGGILVFYIAYWQGLHPHSEQSAINRWFIQSGFLFVWLSSWLLHEIRQILAARNPDRWTSPLVNPKWTRDPDVFIHIILLTLPLITLACSSMIWSLSDTTWGWIALAGAGIYNVSGLLLWRAKAPRPCLIRQATIASILLTVALYLLLDGDALFFALAIEIGLLHLAASIWRQQTIAAAGHLLAAALGLALINRMFKLHQGEYAIWNVQAGADFVYLLVLAVVCKYQLAQRTKSLYGYAAHIGFLLWIMREFSWLDDGQGYVTILWGIYSIVLLVLGLRRNIWPLRRVGMITLFVVVGKLFIVDLAELEMIWRILLFLGFGGLLLLLSYYVQALWKTDTRAKD